MKKPILLHNGGHLCLGSHSSGSPFTCATYLNVIWDSAALRVGLVSIFTHSFAYCCCYFFAVSLWISSLHFVPHKLMWVEGVYGHISLPWSNSPQVWACQEETKTNDEWTFCPVADKKGSSPSMSLFWRHEAAVFKGVPSWTRQYCCLHYKILGPAILISSMNNSQRLFPGTDSESIWRELVSLSVLLFFNCWIQILSVCRQYISVLALEPKDVSKMAGTNSLLE